MTFVSTHKLQAQLPHAQGLNAQVAQVDVFQVPATHAPAAYEFSNYEASSYEFSNYKASNYKASNPSAARSLVFEQPTLQTATSHLVLLTEVLETYRTSEFPQMTVLAALKNDLVAAMNTYRIVCQENAPVEVQLMRESDLLWHCNQCDYYLAQRKGAPLITLSRDRGRWQIRRVVGAVARFKLLTHVRMLMPGPNTLSISWWEILPGIKLWM